MVGPGGGTPTGNVVYESRDQSLVDFVALSKEFFRDRDQAGTLNLVTAYQKVEDDESGMYVGNNAMMVFWTPCDEICNSCNWN
jgi:hypothetical protein